MLTSSRAFFVASMISLVAAACGGSSSSSPDDDRNGNGPGSSQAPSNCPARCSAKAQMCGVDGSGCTQLCGQITREAQIRCLEASPCDEDSARECLKAGEQPDGGSVPDSSTNPPPGKPNKPSELTISGSFGQYEPIHVMSDDQKRIVSMVSIGPKPEFSPSQPSEMPNMGRATRTEVSSPNLGTCAGSFGWTLNSSQLGLVFQGTDTLPNTDCAKFADDLAADGMDAIVPDVAYPTGGGAARITIKLRP